jgi:hypothetical protein
MIQRFEALGSVWNEGEKVIGQFVVPYACRLSSQHPVLAAMPTPIAFGVGASPLDILIRRVQPNGTVGTLETLTFNPGNPAATVAINQDLNAGDGIQLIQIDGNDANGGESYTITMQFVERAA